MTAMWVVWHQELTNPIVFLVSSTLLIETAGLYIIKSSKLQCYHESPYEHKITTIEKKHEKGIQKSIGSKLK